MSYTRNCFSYGLLCGIVLICGTSAKSLKEQEKFDSEDISDLREITSLKLNFVKNVNKIIRHKSFQLFEGVELEQIPGTERLTSGRAAANDNELETLPDDLERKDQKLSGLVEDKVSTILASRSLKLSLDSIFPGVSIRISRSQDDSKTLTVGLDLPEGGRAMGEARTKLKKLLPLLLILKYSAGMAAVVAMSAVAALAGKALIVSKIALALAAIIGIKKLHSGHDDHHGSAYSYVSYPSYGHHGYSRSLDSESSQSEKKAYRGQNS